MKQAQSKGKKGSSKAQLEALQALMATMYGDEVPTLKSIIGEDALPCVRSSANVREAAILMAEVRKGVLVMDKDNELVGILTPKDVLTRVVARGKSADLTAVSSVMTPNPECASADLTLLDALREMHDQKFLHLPVRDESTGCVIGLVDVMELVCSTAGSDGEGGGKGWRAFFNGAMAAKGDGDGSVSESDSAYSNSSGRRKNPVNVPSVDYEDTSDIYPIEAKETKWAGYNHNFETGSVSLPTEFNFKITDDKGNTHRLKCPVESLQELRIAVGDKLGVLSSSLVLSYVDDVKDMIVLKSDACLREAVDFARYADLSTLKLKATVSTLTLSPARGRFKVKGNQSEKEGSDSVPGTIADRSSPIDLSHKNVMILSAIGVVVLGATFVFLKSKRS